MGGLSMVLLRGKGRISVEDGMIAMPASWPAG